MRNKLSDRKGETLTETLCAVLVLALAVSLLAAMISSTFSLERKTDQAANELHQSFSKAEKLEASGTEGTISVQIGEESVPVEVDFYGEKEQASSYRIKSEGTP